MRMKIFGRRSPQVVVRLSEYRGQKRLGVAATHLSVKYPPAEARRIVDEWCEFFAAGPSPIRHLAFLSRTPKRLFEALASQTQLQSLQVKWGDWDDLAPLAGMKHLTILHLGGASSVRSLEPLKELPALGELMVESLKHVRDLSPIGELSTVQDLELGGDWKSPRNVHVDSIEFLRQMPQLRRLILHSMIVDSKDYTPLLSLHSLKEARVMPSRGMKPTHRVLAAAIPALEPVRQRTREEGVQ